MTNAQLTRINGTVFIICLLSIAAGVLVGLLGIWGIIPAADGSLWRALGSCGVVFAGSICASLAIQCFKSNDYDITVPPSADTAK